MHQPACSGMSFGDRSFQRGLFFAYRHAELAACRKRAAFQRQQKIGRSSSERIKLRLAVTGDLGDRVQKSYGIGMLRIIENIAGVPIDHSFLTYKKELLEYGYKVGKISMKEKTVNFERV